MRERTSSTINIVHPDSGGYHSLVTVPITEQSRRKYSLMQEDYIQLVFSLDVPMFFQVGDAILDPVFGWFRLRNEQMPRYNASTGGYDYELRFDREYWLAENHIFMLITEDLQGNKTRSETDWHLTAPLETHVAQAVDNINLIGLDHTYTYSIETSAEHRGEAKHLAYQGTRIISAFNMMASEYGCEWWVTYDDVNRTACVHFGKCENTNEYIDFENGVNVESMDISDNTNTFANRLYFLGGTKNISEAYRRRLILHINNVNSGVTPYEFQDNNRPLAPKMLLHEGVYRSGEDITFTTKSSSWRGSIFTVSARTGLFTIAQDNAAIIYSGIRGAADFLLNSDSIQMSTEWSLNLVDTTDNSKSTTLVSKGNGGNLDYFYRVETAGFTLSVNFPDGEYKQTIATHEYYLEIVLSANGKMGSITYQDSHFGGSIVVDSGKRYNARVIFEGTTYDIYMNPRYLLDGTDYSHFFTFKDGVPAGFGNGSECELLDFNPVQVPLSYYTTEADDPSSLLSVDERRLHLPTNVAECVNGYLQYDETLLESQVVELKVIADNIYPRCYLRVKSVATDPKTDIEEYSDGSRQEWPWKAYTIELEMLNGNAFPFKRDYQQKDEKLELMFLSDMDTDRAYQESGVTPPATRGDYLLAGMTFECDFKSVLESGGTMRTYTLLRSEAYGAKLPNEILKPTVGDVCVLTGWEVKAMDSLGLTAEAETRLFEAAADYYWSIEEGQFTFTCHMMSDWPSSFISGSPFYEAEGKNFYESEGKDFWVKNDGSLYWLPDVGERVRIIHGALKPVDGVGAKESRIIGYELKLDKPWDSPTFVVGETEAYSRIRKIEKELNIQKI